MRTDVGPPSRPSGTISVSAEDEAAARRAGCVPRRTCGTTGSIGNPSPSSVTRPPSIAHSGRTEVIRPTMIVRGTSPRRTPLHARSRGPRTPRRARGSFAGAHSRRDLALVVELDVPVEVIAPRFRRVAQPDGDADGGGLVGTPRHADEVHAGLLWGAAALAAVAGDAAGDDVFPILSAALGDRHHMIEC